MDEGCVKGNAVEYMVRLLRDSEGKAIGFIGIAHEITSAYKKQKPRVTILAGACRGAIHCALFPQDERPLSAWEEGAMNCAPTDACRVSPARILLANSKTPLILSLNSLICKREN